MKEDDGCHLTSLFLEDDLSEVDDFGRSCSRLEGSSNGDIIKLEGSCEQG